MYSLGIGEPVVDRLDHRLHRGERGAQVVARPRDELAARLEQPLDRVGHRVERVGDLDDLGRAALGGPRGEVARRERGRRAAQASSGARIHRASSSAAAQRGERRGRGDGEHLGVGMHLEHDPARGEHAGERQDHGEQRERGELQPQRRQQAQQAARRSTPTASVASTSRIASLIMASAGSRCPRPSRGGAVARDRPRSSRAAAGRGR